MAVSKRNSERVHAVVPVEIEGKREGLSRDVSPNGIFFETTATFETGESIRFSVNFDSPSGKLTLHCQGDIVRTEAIGGKLGVAVKITDSRLEAQPDSLREGWRRATTTT